MKTHMNLIAGSSLAVLMSISHTALAKVSNDDQYLFQLEAPKSLTPNLSVRLARKFLGAKLINPKPNEDRVVRFVSPKDLNETFEHNLKTGDISFRRYFSKYQGTYEPSLPSTKDALNAAKEFLVSNQLLPNDTAQLELTHVGGLRAAIVDKHGQHSNTIDKLITLSFSRRLNDQPVIGTGSKIVVNVGNESEIVSVIHKWREINKKWIQLSVNELVQDDEAKEKFYQKLESDFGKNTKAEILDVQSAYFDSNGRFLQPVYVYQSRIYLPDSNAEPFEYASVIPMMRTPPEPLFPEGKLVSPKQQPLFDDSDKLEQRKEQD